jgi:hypothetical protein
MNTHVMTANSRKSKTDVVQELQREARGSFSVFYRALREASLASGTGSAVNKSDVIRAIHRIQAADKKTAKK